MISLTSDQFDELRNLCRDRFDLVSDGEQLFDGQNICALSVFLTDGSESASAEIVCECRSGDRVRHLVALRTDGLDGCEEFLPVSAVTSGIESPAELESCCDEFETGWDAWGSMEEA